MDVEISIHFAENSREAARAARMKESMKCLCCDWASKDECDCGGVKMQEREQAGAAVTLGETNEDGGLFCPHCPDRGWYIITGRDGEPEQEQCEWCWTVPNSKFNLGTGATPPPEGETKPHMNSHPENVPENLFGIGDNDSYYKDA